MEAALKLAGYVTTLGSIAGRPSEELEDVLGFNRGALKAGYRVYRLAELIAPGDFEWKDRTRYADGWHYDSTIGEYVQRQDERRWSFRKRSDYDGNKGDAEFDGFIREQRRLLNVRTGWAQIVKVVPNVRPTGFPDSEARNVPQWYIDRKRPKAFTLLFDVGPGERCPATIPR